MEVNFSETVKEESVIVETAAKLAAVEVGLGALIHGFKIPVGGHLLSLNQGFFLTRLTRKMRKTQKPYKFPLTVSNISAVLKSLSPAGNRLGPMVSICAQGYLFSISILIFGANIIGVLIGMALLSTWSFVQPLLTLYFLYGHSILNAGQFYLEKMQQLFAIQSKGVFIFLICLFLIKLFISQLLAFLGFFKDETALNRWDLKLAGFKVERPGQRFETQAYLQEFMRPLFWVPFIFMIGFFYFSEGSWAKTFWLALRPVGLTILIIYLSHTKFGKRIFSQLKNFKITRNLWILVDKTWQKMNL